MGRRTAWVAGWAIVIAALTAAAVAARPRALRIELKRPLPVLVRVRDWVAIAGHVRGGGGALRVALQVNPLQPSSPGGWSTVASAPVGGGGAFRLHWHVRSMTLRFVWLRVALVRGARIMDVAGTRRTLVGSAVVHCKPPPPAGAIPAGYGRIVGGIYIVGGAPPGVDECQSGTATVLAVNTAGVVVARDRVHGQRSYVLVVPAGSYTLATGWPIAPCRGTAQVRVGATTRANTICDVP